MRIRLHVVHCWGLKWPDAANKARPQPDNKRTPLKRQREQEEKRIETVTGIPENRMPKHHYDDEDEPHARSRIIFDDRPLKALDGSIVTSGGKGESSEGSAKHDLH
ncbi:MAG: hypothetical protein Q9218_005013 [Villophora microphyllina]